MNLADALDKYNGGAFHYGVLDCCIFVCGVIQELTGKDYYAPFRGRYYSEFTALRLIRRYGSFKGIACAAFGEMRPFWSARAGDPVLLRAEFADDDPIHAALGIFDGNVIWYLCADGGTDFAPITAAKGCWHV